MEANHLNTGERVQETAVNASDKADTAAPGSSMRATSANLD